MRTSNFYGGYGFNQGRNSSRKSVCNDLEEIQSTNDDRSTDETYERPSYRQSYRPSTRQTYNKALEFDDDYDIEEGNQKVRLTRIHEGKESAGGYCCF